MPTTTKAGQPAPSLRWLRGLAGLARRLPGLARSHRLLTVLLVAGLALRVATQVAYRPALMYIDSIKYLFGAYPGNDPPGYQLMVQPLAGVVDPAAIAAAQHLLGLAMAVALYAVLRRRGAPRWLSALAVAPILLDAYQLQIEQTIMPDTVFEALIVAGLAALLWRPQPGNALIATAGLALGASATVRQVGEIFILPALLYLLITLPRWRRLLANTALLTAAFALPILGASYRNYVAIHHFALAPYALGTIYGRMAAAADCATLTLPAYERPLCPSAADQRKGPDWLDHMAGSPNRTYVAPPGMDRGVVVSAFEGRVLLEQPLNVLAAIGTDALKLFAVERVTSPGDAPISRWQFQPGYPGHPPYIVVSGGVIYFNELTRPLGLSKSVGTSLELGGGPATAARPLASFLRSYQLGGGYTPGPLYLFAVLASLAGAAVLPRRRLAPARRGAALASLLFFSSGVVVLLASDAFEFSWRYQLPALITLPPAAALGLVALLGRSRAAAEDPARAGQAAARSGASGPGATGPAGAGAGADKTPPGGTQARDRASTS